jgi:hypothetical protein
MSYRGQCRACAPITLRYHLVGAAPTGHIAVGAVQGNSLSNVAHPTPRLQQDSFTIAKAVRLVGSVHRLEYMVGVVGSLCHRGSCTDRADADRARAGRPLWTANQFAGDGFGLCAAGPNHRQPSGGRLPGGGGHPGAARRAPALRRMCDGRAASQLGTSMMRAAADVAA